MYDVTTQRESNREWLVAHKSMVSLFCFIAFQKMTRVNIPQYEYSVIQRLS